MNLKFSKWQTDVFGIGISGVLSCFYRLKVENKCAFPPPKKIWNIFIYFNWNGTKESRLGRERKKINLMKNIFINTINGERALWRHSCGVKGFFGWNTGGRESSFQHALEHPLSNTFLVWDLRFLSNKVGCIPLFSKTVKHMWNFKNTLMWCLCRNVFLRLGTFYTSENWH